jgi:hypothetical protein
MNDAIEYRGSCRIGVATEAILAATFGGLTPC